MAPARINDRDLIAYAAGDLTGAEAVAVERHLARDAEARATVERYRAAREAIRSDDSFAPPAEVLRRAKAIFREQQAATPGWLDRLDALVATLVFDSRLQPAAVRYRPGDGEFQLAFEAGDADIDLQLVRNGNGSWLLRGQITCDRREPFAVAFCPAGTAEPKQCLQTDDRGMFETPLESGVYDVIVELPDQAVLMRHIQVK